MSCAILFLTSFYQCYSIFFLYHHELSDCSYVFTSPAPALTVIPCPLPLVFSPLFLLSSFTPLSPSSHCFLPSRPLVSPFPPLSLLFSCFPFSRPLLLTLHLSSLSVLSLPLQSSSSSYPFLVSFLLLFFNPLMHLIFLYSHFSLFFSSTCTHSPLCLLSPFHCITQLLRHPASLSPPPLSLPSHQHE